MGEDYQREIKAGSSPYPEVVKAEAVNMWAQGFSYRRVQRALQEKFGEAPDVHTLFNWRQDANIDQRIRMGAEDIILEGQDKIRMAFEAIDTPAIALKNLFAINAATHTPWDKLLAEQRNATPGTVNFGIFVLTPAQHEATIDTALPTDVLPDTPHTTPHVD